MTTRKRLIEVALPAGRGRCRRAREEKAHEGKFGVQSVTFGVNRT